VGGQAKLVFQFPPGFHEVLAHGNSAVVAAWGESAGTRTGDLGARFPEEADRQMIVTVAMSYFASAAVAQALPGIVAMTNADNHIQNTHDTAFGGPINTNIAGGALAGDIDLTTTDGRDETTADPVRSVVHSLDVPVAADSDAVRWGIGALQMAYNYGDSAVGRRNTTSYRPSVLQGNRSLCPQ
jgi:hypothetical protein